MPEARLRPPSWSFQDRSRDRSRPRILTFWMRSPVHLTYATRYRVSNWAEYERSLVRRGGGQWCQCHRAAYEGGRAVTTRAAVTCSRMDDPSRQLGRSTAVEERVGIHQQSRAQDSFLRYKAIIGDRLCARHPDAQQTEALIGGNILNRMFELGRPRPCTIGA